MRRVCDSFFEPVLLEPTWLLGDRPKNSFNPGALWVQFTDILAL